MRYRHEQRRRQLPGLDSTTGVTHRRDGSCEQTNGCPRETFPVKVPFARLCSLLVCRRNFFFLSDVRCRTSMSLCSYFSKPSYSRSSYLRLARISRPSVFLIFVVYIAREQEFRFI